MEHIGKRTGTLLGEEEPLFVLRPRWNPRGAFRRRLPLFAFLAVWGGGFVGGGLLLLAKAFALSWSPTATYLAAGLASGVLLARWCLWRDRWRVESAEYRFFADALLCLGPSPWRLDYRRVEAVRWRASANQRASGLGTVVLETARGECRLADLPSPEEVARRARTFIARARAAEAYVPERGAAA